MTLTDIPGLASMGEAFSVLSIARALWKRKVLMLMLWICGCGAIVFVVSRMKPVFQADTVILVEPQKIPENFVPATVQVMLEARLDVLKQQALSRERLWMLITELDLYSQERKQLTQMEVIQKMREEDITVTLERTWSANRPGAFRIAYVGGDPRRVAEVTNRIGQYFIEENLRQREAEAEGAAEFLGGQLEESRVRLRQQEARLSEFKISHNGELPTQEAGLVGEVAQARTELTTIQEAMTRAEQNKVIHESSLTLMKETMARRREVDQLRSQQALTASSLPARGAENANPLPTPLDLARADLATARGRYLDAHPEVQSALRRVRQLEKEELAALAERAKRRAAAPGTLPALTLADRQAEMQDAASQARLEEITQRITAAAQEIESLKTRRMHVLGQIETLKVRLLKVPQNEQALTAITRDYDTSNLNYASLLRRKLDADTSTNMEKQQKSQKLVMLDRAKVPEKPIRPKREILIGGGSVVMLLLSLLAAFVLELRRNVVLGEWELPPGTVVLGRVPVITVNES
jgi:polysaccharide chain length determinant protein (PEP-CTERM system associated)